MRLLGPILAFDRETLMLGALGSLILAGLVVSITAWVLLATERKRGRASREGADPAAPPESQPAPEARPE